MATIKGENDLQIHLEIEVIRSTDKAILFKGTLDKESNIHNEVWLAKSQINVLSNDGVTAEIIVPQWLNLKHPLV